MRAIVIERPGGPEVLQLREVADPVPGPREVLVAVRATALNRADLLQRLGRYPAPAGWPQEIPGLEFAGEIVKTGAAVDRLRCGDRVMGLLGGGGYAELVRLDERLCMRIPPQLDWAEAAAIPEAFLTSFDALFLQGGLSVGETVLIHAAGSGVGTAAVQLALSVGARVVALSRTEQKRRRLEQFGALRTLDPAREGLAEQIRLASNDDGVDLVLDLVGGPAFGLNADVLRRRGRWVVLGLLGGARAETNLGLLMQKRINLTGSVLRSRPIEEHVALVRSFSHQVLPLLASGVLHPVVHATLPLERAADAHAMLERNDSFGKIVLQV
ncbi:MAG: NAD(P)H-quinone oxidoreductase [bacterium]|nr:NAD(P)H-quinone oxidoreductase [bacterium]